MMQRINRFPFIFFYYLFIIFFHLNHAHHRFRQCIYPNHPRFKHLPEQYPCLTHRFRQVQSIDAFHRALVTVPANFDMRGFRQRPVILKGQFRVAVSVGVSHAPVQVAYLYTVGALALAAGAARRSAAISSAPGFGVPDERPAIVEAHPGSHHREVLGEVFEGGHSRNRRVHVSVTEHPSGEPPGPRSARPCAVRRGFPAVYGCRY